MKQLKLSVSHREELGSRACWRLRKTGQIPAVIYGKSGSDSIQVQESEFRKLMRSIAGSVSLIEVVADKGPKKLSVIEKVQREPSTGVILHVDFHEVSPDEEMHATLPVHTSGDAIGVKDQGGVLEVMLHHIDVKCLPKNLPEHMTIDISELKVGDAIHIKNLPAMPGVTILGDPETVVAACSEPRKVEEEVVIPEAAPAEGTETKAEATTPAAESTTPEEKS